jgi:hypothetical protein
LKEREAGRGTLIMIGETYKRNWKAATDTGEKEMKLQKE